MADNNAHGFSLSDHRRVSRVIRDAERGLYGPGTAAENRPEKRDAVRVMWLNGPIYNSTPGQPQTTGDFELDGAQWDAVITEPLFGGGTWDANIMPGGLHYFVRCTSAPANVPRTWQLRVMPPGSDVTLTPGFLTSPIREYATGLEVAAAINATGCPAVKVAGYENTVQGVMGTEVGWPQRVWHIFWPGDPLDMTGWFMTVTRPIHSGANIGYEVADGEVAIQLVPTCYQPTAFSESISLPYQRANSPPLPGSFAMCQSVHGKGLVVIDSECWQYTD